MMRISEPVDISKSILVCNLFHFLFAAAKSSLYPFLTLYLRQLGFTGIETGVIMGSKTLVVFMAAPVWSRCAVKRYKRRAMLMCSLFMLTAVYLSVSIIVTKYKDDMCETPLNNESTTESSSINQSTFDHPLATLGPTTMERLITNHKLASYHSMSPYNVSNLYQSSEVSISHEIKSTTATPASSVTLPEDLINDLKRISSNYGLSLRNLSSVPPTKVKAMIDAAQDDDKYLVFLKNRTVSDISLILKSLRDHFNAHDSYDRNSTRFKRYDTDSVYNKTWSVVRSGVKHIAKSMKTQFHTLPHQLFFIIFSVLVIGEIFASPVEKIADDAWYDFLDEIDYLDNYGKHRLWSTVAFLLFPIISTVLVDNTPCSLGFNLNHMAIHFYMFSGLLGLAFIVAIFYPMPSANKRKYVSKVLHGCSILFCKYRNFTYVLCLLVMGLCYSTVNYLFWVVADLGGQELPMGLAVATASLSELPMLLLSESLVKKFSNAGLVVVSMFSFSIRLLYYSFLWVDWAVVPIELLYAFSHTCMWWAVLSNPDFSFSNPVERSVRSILSSVYFGIGYGFGSLASGVVYDYLGAAVLFRGASVLAIAWSLVFIALQKLLPKGNAIRYSKLLQGDDDDDELSDGSTRNMEHDWLEQALRDR